MNGSVRVEHEFPDVIIGEFSRKIQVENQNPVTEIDCTMYKFLFAISILVCGLNSLSAADHPNVLIIYADDLGFGDLRVNNPKSKIPTPNLNRLAEQGMRFTDGHSSSGICTPSRYALLTGRHHWRDFHGIVNAFGGSVFKPQRLTLPEMMKQRGYDTAAIGKWHLGWDWDAIKKPGAKGKKAGRNTAWGPEAFDWEKTIPDGPLAHGFDHYFGDTVINFPPYCWIEDDKVVKAPDTLIFDGKSQAGPYGDFLFETDSAIGRLLTALDESGQAENTVVIFTADNGPEKYAYARDAQYDHWSSTPFRGLKRDIYEGGHHVPFIVRWPGLTKAGATCNALVSQIDIMATLAASLEFALPKDAAEDSHDLTPLLMGSTTPIRTTHVHNTKVDHYAIRHGDWLLVDAKDGYVSGRNKVWEDKWSYPADDDQAVELYDLSTDPGQRNNLATANAQKVQQLRTLLKTVREQGYSAPRLAP